MPITVRYCIRCMQHHSRIELLTEDGLSNGYRQIMEQFHRVTCVLQIAFPIFGNFPFPSCRIRCLIPAPLHGFLPSKLLLYSSFISCYLNYYCCVLWHFCNNSDTLKIEKLQEKALRYYILDFKSPYQQLLLNCGKSTLFLQRLQKLMEVIYRILNELYPSYLNDIITVEELQHLRCRSRLFIPPFSTVRYGKKSLSYLSPVLWNSLGNDIKQCDVLTAFKKRIKLWKGPTCNCGFCAQCRISNR